MNLSVIYRVSGGYLVIIICLLIIATAGVIGLTNINRNLQSVAQDAAPVKQLTNSISEAVTAANFVMYQSLNAVDNTALQTYEIEFEEARQIFASGVDDLINRLDKVTDSDISSYIFSEKLLVYIITHQLLYVAKTLQMLTTRHDIAESQ